MARLETGRAPPASWPLRFLLTAPLWGVTAGLLLLLDGEGALQSRWAPSALALVHVHVLGVFGNLMFGSLLQFLPAAAGVTLGAGDRAITAMHIGLNLGTFLLVAGLRLGPASPWLPAVLLPASLLLACAFAVLGWITLPGLFRGRTQQLLRAGIAAAMLAGIATALLGAAMAFGLAGLGGLPASPWVDAHAAWGLAGWVLLLLASVGRIVMPMFQGTAAMPARLQAGWTLLVLAVLLAGSWQMASSAGHGLLRAGTAALGGSWVLLALWLHWRAPVLRITPLRLSWRTGLIVLVLSTVALAGGDGRTAFVLAVGAGLPLLLVGMQMEIVAFVAWIELRRRTPRGLRVPGVQSLVQERGKYRVLGLFGGSGLLLVLAVQWPGPWLARLAAVLGLAANVALWRLLRAATRVQLAGTARP